MDEESFKCWASRPDACRCCLSACGIWNINLVRESEFGVKEIYSDMLQECFDIIVSFDFFLIKIKPTLQISFFKPCYYAQSRIKGKLPVTEL